MARYFADECVSDLVVRELRRLGHDVEKATDVCPGAPDEAVLKLASTSGCILITDDLGFGELAVRHARKAIGIIILSVYALPAGTREPYAAKQIAALASNIHGHLAVIEPGRVRLRPLPA